MKTNNLVYSIKLRFAFLLLYYLFVVCFSSICLAITEDTELKYIKSDEIKVIVKTDFFSSRFLVRISHLQIQSKNFLGKIVKYNKGYLYHNEHESIYAEGFSVSEFEGEAYADNSIRKKIMDKAIIFYFLIPATAQASIFCENSNRNFENIENINSKICLSGVMGFINKCNFSPIKMIEEQITSIANTTNAIVTGELWHQISEAMSAIQKMLPNLYSNLIIPLGALVSEVPTIAQNLICSFTKTKIGQIAATALMGGTSLPLVIARTGIESVEILHKVSILHSSKKLIAHIKDLEKRGLLNEETIGQILRLHKEMPQSHDKLNIRFRSSENLTKHFEKHKGEFGVKSPEEYERAAKEFVTRKNSHDTVYTHKDNGDIEKVDLATGEFVKMNQYGNVITYFKLSCKHEHEKLLYVLYAKEAASRGICSERN